MSIYRWQTITPVCQWLTNGCSADNGSTTTKEIYHRRQTNYNDGHKIGRPKKKRPISAKTSADDLPTAEGNYDARQKIGSASLHHR